MRAAMYLSPAEPVPHAGPDDVQLQGGNMLELTPRAEKHLLNLRVQRGFDQTDGARFVTNAGRVGLTFTSAPKPKDRVIEGADLPIYVAPEAIEALDEATVDAEPEDGKTVLVIRRARGARKTNGGKTDGRPSS
jgi:Fe-S cluster assembly iron-binding protein IscA